MQINLAQFATYRLPWISIMTGKLKGMRAINTNPLTNSYCTKMCKSSGTICASCYSRRMLLGARKSCVPSFSYNSELLSSGVLPDSQLPMLNDLIFRFSAHGELINKTHAINLHNIAKKNPGTTFGWWTKRPGLLPRERLSNVNYIYSTPYVNVLNPKLPKGFDKTFNVYTKEFAEEHNININCHGGCNECRLCYEKNDVTHINEVIKGKPLKELK